MGHMIHLDRHIPPLLRSLFFLVEVLIPLASLVDVFMPLSLLAEVLILFLDLLMEVTMHLYLVREILMMPMQEEEDQICHSSYWTRDILYLAYCIINLMLYMLISIYIIYFSFLC